MAKYDPIDTVQDILEQVLKDDVFLVEFKVKPVNNIKIFLDADSGLGIEKCIRINRRLYKQIEEMELFPEGDFSIEVSSPGLDAPLKLHRQYVKNIGRSVEVTFTDETVVEGNLDAVTEEFITVTSTSGKGKKMLMETKEYPFTDIAQTKVKIKF